MVGVPGGSNVRGREGTAKGPSLPTEDYVRPDCGFSYSDTSVEQVPQEVDLLPGQVRAAIAVVPREQLHRRVREDSWSVPAYVCHLRDVYVTSTIRLHRAVTEHRPVLEPMLNDLRARRFRYNKRDIKAVLDDLALAAAGFQDEATAVRPENWGRQVARSPGEYRSARWLVRHALHEGRHHLRDITALIRSIRHR